MAVSLPPIGWDAQLSSASSAPAVPRRKLVEAKQPHVRQAELTASTSERT